MRHRYAVASEGGHVDFASGHGFGEGSGIWNSSNGFEAFGQFLDYVLLPGAEQAWYKQPRFGELSQSQWGIWLASPAVRRSLVGRGHGASSSNADAGEDRGREKHHWARVLRNQTDRSPAILPAWVRVKVQLLRRQPEDRASTLARPAAPCTRTPLNVQGMHQRAVLQKTPGSVAIERIYKSATWGELNNALTPPARLLRRIAFVRIILESLLALQTLELVPGEASPERDQQLVVLRGKIPERLLAHYDSLMANGRNGVARVQDGTCSECRQPVVPSALNGLAHDHPIQICIHCRCFLYWPVEESGGKPRAASRGSPAHRRRSSPAHV
jgi:hypothetical protein